MAFQLAHLLAAMVLGLARGVALAASYAFTPLWRLCDGITSAAYQLTGRRRNSASEGGRGSVELVDRATSDSESGAGDDKDKGDDDDDDDDDDDYLPRAQLPVLPASPLADLAASPEHDADDEDNDGGLDDDDDWAEIVHGEYLTPREAARRVMQERESAAHCAVIDRLDDLFGSSAPAA